MIKAHGGNVESLGWGWSPANPHFNNAGGKDGQGESFAGWKACGFQPFPGNADFGNDAVFERVASLFNFQCARVHRIRIGK